VLDPTRLVLLVLPEELLLIYQVVFISPEPLDLLIEPLQVMPLLLPPDRDLPGLLLPCLLQLGQISHQPVVLLLVEL